jgi:hypothetical protein
MLNIINTAWDIVLIIFKKYNNNLYQKCNVTFVVYPGKGVCADPVNKGAILGKEGGRAP